MRLATSSQSQEIDRLAQEEFQLQGDVLMEAAGSIAAKDLVQTYLPEIRRGRIGVLVGPGNNGGDGLVVARHLHSMGYAHLIVFLATSPEKLSELSKIQYERAAKQGVQVEDVSAEGLSEEHLSDVSLLVDGLFGVGLSRDIDGKFAQTIEVANKKKCPILSLDIPSGLDADAGNILGACIKADATICFGLAKPGMYVQDGPEMSGRIRVYPIGFPRKLVREVARTHSVFGRKLAAHYLPERNPKSNKSHHGRLLVIAGHEGMWGAGVLAALSSYRAGTGYVTLASFDDPAEVVGKNPDILTAKLETISDFGVYSAIVVGPGLGTDERVQNIIERLKADYKGPVVIDADALTVSASKELYPFPENWVATPHSGELSRFLNEKPEEIDSSRYEWAMKAADKLGCTVLLKGFHTVIAEDKRVAVVPSGNASLAKAGTGDVLAGLIGGLMAQGLSSVAAAGTGAYLHGRIADDWVKKGGSTRSLMASDLYHLLPSVISDISAENPVV